MPKSFLPRLLFAPRCWGCDAALTDKTDFCGRCRREILRALDSSGCLLKYQGAVKGLLSCLRGSAPHLAAAWCHSLLQRNGQMERWRALNFDSVALAPQNSREGERGLVWLGRAVARELKVPLRQPFSKVDRRSQHGRKLGDRMDAPCFVRLNGHAGLGKHILLLDDVYTTGTTLDQCAYLLRKAGAAEVVCFSLARQVMPGFERKEKKPEEKGEEVDPFLLHLFM